MTTLTLEQVRHVAGLARLALTPEEEVRYQGQLSAILEAVAQLDALDTSQVPPTSQLSLASASLREDAVRPSLAPEDALANAPAKSGTSFAVPRILE
jgi:aspartyl-tRNA(Asn)/glutamyl-tRNA(Gln) amidotransferase subunit C